MTEGYIVKDYGQRVKRYCQMLDLKDDAKLIEEYCHLHSEEQSWKEIQDGIHEVGILEMDIYRLKNHLVMIVETPLDFEWEPAMERLAALPRQSEWENLVEKYQQCKPRSTSNEKWKMMERMFHLYRWS